MTSLAIFDIDGCCINCDARVEHYRQGDYERFKSMWHLDRQIPQGVLVYSLLLKTPGLKCVFLTSRGEDQRQTTAHQLSLLFPGADYELWMQDPNNRKPCEVYKVEAIRDHGFQPEDVFIAFDDHSEVVAAYRALGIVAYQTAERVE